MVLVKARLDQDVTTSFQKFKVSSIIPCSSAKVAQVAYDRLCDTVVMCVQDESEEYVSQTWRKVALCQKDMHKQLTSYQSAIDALVVSMASQLLVYHI